MCSEFYNNWKNTQAGLRNDSEHTVREDLPEGKLIKRRDFENQSLLEIIHAHIAMRDQSPEDLVKFNKKRCVSRIAYSGEDYIVKEFRRPGPWGRFSSDARAWVNNWGLELCGIPVPKAYGWLRASDGSGYLVFEQLNGKGAYHYLNSKADDPDCIDTALKRIYDIVTALYKSRIVHEDLKLGNFIVNKDQVRLIDNDAVQFDVDISEKHWKRNLKQLTKTREGAVRDAVSEFFDGMPKPY